MAPPDGQNCGAKTPNRCVGADGPLKAGKTDRPTGAEPEALMSSARAGIAIDHACQLCLSQEPQTQVGAGLPPTPTPSPRGMSEKHDLPVESSGPVPCASTSLRGRMGSRFHR